MQRNGKAYNEPEMAIRASQSDPSGSLGNFLIRITQRADRFIREFMHDLAYRNCTDLRMQQQTLVPVKETHRVNTERALARSVKV